MTTLNEVYGVYTNLRKILNKVNIQTANGNKASDAICAALCDLESAMAYLPMEDTSDRKIKTILLKQSIMLAAEDANGAIDLDNLSDFQREQLNMTLELLKE